MNSNAPSPKDPDLLNIEFNRDGIVRMALGRKETQQKKTDLPFLWDKTMTAILLAMILVLGYHVESRHPIRRLTLIRESGYNFYFKIGYTCFGIVLNALIPACLVVFIMAVINGMASPPVLYTDRNLTEFFSTTLGISLMLVTVMIAKSRLWAPQMRFKGVTAADYGNNSRTIHSDDTERETYNVVMRARMILNVKLF